MVSAWRVVEAVSHSRFWPETCILAIEDEDDFTPYYHSAYDQLSSLDLLSFDEEAMGYLTDVEIAWKALKEG